MLFYWFFIIYLYCDNCSLFTFINTFMKYSRNVYFNLLNWLSVRRYWFTIHWRSKNLGATRRQWRGAHRLCINCEVVLCDLFLILNSIVFNSNSVCYRRGVFYSLVEKHFPAPDRQKTQDLFYSTLFDEKPSKKRKRTNKSLCLKHNYRYNNYLLIS